MPPDPYGRVELNWLHLIPGEMDVELRQLEDEGRRVGPVLGELKALIRMAPDKLALPRNQAGAAALPDKAQTLRGHDEVRIGELAERIYKQYKALR